MSSVGKAGIPLDQAAVRRRRKATDSLGRRHERITDRGGSQAQGWAGARPGNYIPMSSPRRVGAFWGAHRGGRRSP
jgi:hypothetical protein